jgi:hypothetical protein
MIRRTNDTMAKIARRKEPKRQTFVSRTLKRKLKELALRTQLNIEVDKFVPDE